MRVREQRQRVFTQAVGCGRLEIPGPQMRCGRREKVMNELASAMHALHAFLENHGIDTENLTVIINIRDRREAAKFDAALSRWINEICTFKNNAQLNKSIADLNVCGIKVKIESPLHTT
jgi:hypothetical protein